MIQSKNHKMKFFLIKRVCGENTTDCTEVEKAEDLSKRWPVANGK